jgi:hypothetical protein
VFWRLHGELTRRAIWAGRSRTAREAGRVVRRNTPGPNGEASLTQAEIARWPHGTRIDLGRLGDPQ